MLTCGRAAAVARGRGQRPPRFRGRPGKVGRVVYCTGLEIRRAGNGTVSSNLTPSATGVFARGMTVRNAGLHPSGATLTTSSAVVTPAATFIAPDTRSGFMPSLNACSRSRASSQPGTISRRSPGVIVMIS